MNGMINYGKGSESTHPSGAAIDSEGTDTPTGGASMLEQIERNVEQNLDKTMPQLKQAYMNIVVAGRQAMFSEKTHEIMVKYMQNITGPQDVPKIVAHGIVKLLSELYTRSNGKMSTDSSAVAAITLMTYALKYVEGALNIDVTKAMIDETTQATITGVFAFLGIKPEQIEAELAKGQATETPEPATQAVPEGSA